MRYLEAVSGRGAQNAGLEICRTGIKRTKNAGVENVGMTKCKHQIVQVCDINTA